MSTSRDRKAEPPKQPREWLVYLRHVLALFWPGANPGQFVAHRGTPGDVTPWDREAVAVLIEEGRRQVDRQRAELDRVQGRAQFTFTVAVTVLVALATLAPDVRDATGIVQFGWAVGLGFLLLGMLGAAALMSVRATVGGIDASNLSNEGPATAVTAVAQGYANIVAVGENTVATRITVYRDAVFLTVTGALIHGVYWVTAAFS